MAYIGIFSNFVSENRHEIFTPHDGGGGWITGCGSRPQSVQWVEEREESVWSVVRQENERGDHGKV